MIKIIPKFLSIVLLLALSESSLATTDTTDIKLSFTHTNYVNLTGTVVGASRFFSESDVRPVSIGSFGPRVTLGTLGLESNLPGACTITFTTTNEFKLRHTTFINNNGKYNKLASYRLFYRNQKLNNNNNDINIPSCNITTSALELSTRKNYNQNPKAGIYQDIMTITVTTQ